ncbi:MAG: hypothetical protein NUV76_12110 [Candidatus Kuenenia sp.]|nr:hypothetical protein [Candidatus Kuenenia sp.]
MGKWKREVIEYGTIVIFASLAWWWVSKEFQKPPAPPNKSLSAEPVKIYQGAWRKGGYLEVQK